MNLNPPSGKIEECKASGQLRDLEPKDFNGSMSQQGSTAPDTLSNTTPLNITTQSKPIAFEDQAKDAKETKEAMMMASAKGIHTALPHVLDLGRAITYPFNWEQNSKKKITNGETFSNKADKKKRFFPFKTVVNEMNKESFYPEEFLQWSMLHTERKNDAKHRNGHTNHLNAHSTQKEPHSQEKAHSIGGGTKEEGEVHQTKDNNEGDTGKFKESYLDLLIESANALINKGLKINSLKDYEPPEQNALNDKSINSTDIISRSPLPQPKDTTVPTTAASVHFFQKKCENKICPVTVNKMSNIHQARVGTEKNKMLSLCSQCYKAWKNGQYCYYCGVIFREYNGTKGFNESKMWVACEFCKNWEHLACEEQRGAYPNLSKLIKDTKFKYDCPACRKKPKEKEDACHKDMECKSLLQKRTRTCCPDDYSKLSVPMKRLRGNA